MSFIRVKTVNGVSYYSLVESVRENGKVRQKLVRYFGKELPEAYRIDKIKKKQQQEKMERRLTSKKKTRTIRINTDDYWALDKIRNQKSTNSHEHLNMGDTVKEVVEHYQNSIHPPA